LQMQSRKFRTIRSFTCSMGLFVDKFFIYFIEVVFRAFHRHQGFNFIFFSNRWRDFTTIKQYYSWLIQSPRVLYHYGIWRLEQITEINLWLQKQTQGISYFYIKVDIQFYKKSEL
jgi:hypothetical protein